MRTYPKSTTSFLLLKPVLRSLSPPPGIRLVCSMISTTTSLGCPRFCGTPHLILFPHVLVRLMISLPYLLLLSLLPLANCVRGVPRVEGVRSRRAATAQVSGSVMLGLVRYGPEQAQARTTRRHAQTMQYRQLRRRWSVLTAQGLRSYDRLRSK